MYRYIILATAFIASPAAAELTARQQEAYNSALPIMLEKVETPQAEMLAECIVKEANRSELRQITRAEGQTPPPKGTYDLLNVIMQRPGILGCMTEKLSN